MAHHRVTLVSVVLALIVVALVASAKADLYDDCIAAFLKRGTKEDLIKGLPSCQQGLSALRQCCAETKDWLKAVPANCLCDARVWAEVERWTLADSGFDGLDARNLRMFYNICGIRNAGSGTC